MRYYVVYRDSLEELVKEVNRLIGEGWRNARRGILDSIALPPAPPNIGMHPTRNSAALKLNLSGGRVMPGVMPHR